MNRECSTNGGEEECIYYFGGKARKNERNKQLGKPRRMWKNNIKMDLRET
jgi:hypothetical protein